MNTDSPGLVHVIAAREFKTLRLESRVSHKVNPKVVPLNVQRNPSRDPGLGDIFPTPNGHQSMHLVINW
ncbi:hypothetical protein N7468_007629 [Penicillium chermesinum]|uniref:Uncharacterized protein n=1 Tax=Penicillium chermesinum TaxID=63820 RepID=A0A9W9NXC6_9EURO|nr:uncharacterized protein N7468_007629 [Penicillium chermesinum]KAJ5226404.1 hypothetical protein N7468_007629 [Penicillium chermesinum]